MANLPQQYDVFLSHSSIDSLWAQRLKTALRRTGLKVWLDKDEIRPGDLFVEVLESAIQCSKTVVLIVSPEAIASNWVKEEYSRALALANSSGASLRLIPLLLRNATLPGFLSNRHCVDFCDETHFPKSLQQLLWGITGVKTADVSEDMHDPKQRNTAEVESHSDSITDPYISAIDEALRVLPPAQPQPRFVVRAVSAPAELENLWNLDTVAYGQASITYEQFWSWWQAFPPGLKALFCGPAIRGALGIWPISGKWSTTFKSGKVKEAEMQPGMLRAFRKSAAQHWYVSGIVLQPDLRRTEAIKLLLADGLRKWLEDGRAEYPLEMLALAYSTAGEALLERFGFVCLQNAGRMADRFPLYGIQFASKSELLATFSRRGLRLE